MAGAPNLGKDVFSTSGRFVDLIDEAVSPFCGQTRKCGCPSTRFSEPTVSRRCTVSSAFRATTTLRWVVVHNCRY